MADAISGTVKFISHDHTYGFIKGDDETDYFFHKEQCDESLRAMAKNDGVMFQPGANARGPIAMRVTAFPVTDR